MSPSAAPHPKQSSAESPPDGEEPVSVPPDNVGPLDVHTGGSTLEAAPVYDQVEPWLLLVQMGQQPNFPPDEASIADFNHIMNENTHYTLTSYLQTQSQVIEGHFAIQSATEDRRNRTTGSTGRRRPACLYCSQDFGRIQELGRHVKDKHMDPHQYLFSGCHFMWTRPCKLKDHLLADHKGGFSPEILEAIKPLRSQGFFQILG